MLEMQMEGKTLQFTTNTKSFMEKVKIDGRSTKKGVVLFTHALHLAVSDLNAEHFCTLYSHK